MVWPNLIHQLSFSWQEVERVSREIVLYSGLGFIALKLITQGFPIFLTGLMLKDLVWRFFHFESSVLGWNFRNVPGFSFEEVQQFLQLKMIESFIDPQRGNSGVVTNQTQNKDCLECKSLILS